MNLRCLALALPLIRLTALAQDARTVTAPILPRVPCATLHATRTAVTDHLAPNSTDTALLQSALDRCRPRAVELALGTDSSSIFLADSLTLNDGATLLLDKSVTLLASPTSSGSLLNITGTHVSILGDGIIDGRNDASLLTAHHADALTLSRITLRNSLGVSIASTTGFTAWGIHLLATTPHTNGIRLSNSTDITIAHSWISVPGDNIALDSVQRISLLDNHLYSGTGLSIANSPDSALLLDGLSEDATTSGLRIVGDSALHLRNICLRGVPDAISIYAPSDPTIATPRIQLERITSTTPATLSIAGADAAHPAAVSLSSILITGIQPAQVSVRFAALTLGPGPVDFTPAGDGVTLTKLSDHGHLTPVHACTARSFPPMQ